MEKYILKEGIPGSERNKLVDFIDNHWKKGHALVKSTILLDFQHYNSKTDSYSFIVAENRETGEYDAIIGYIPTSQFDPALAENGDYWGAIWKRRIDVNNEEIKDLGLRIWERIFELPHFTSLGNIGLSREAFKFYKAARLKTGYLRHYYILNDKINRFEIAGNVDKKDILSPEVPNKTEYSVRWIDINTLYDKDIKPIYRPLKSITYFKNRYLNHPIYKYRFLGLFNNETLSAVIAVRAINVGESRILRIIDVLGRMEGYILPTIREILYNENFEYIDFMNLGLDVEIVKEMGFKELDYENDILILPNYFEPFERANYPLSYSYRSNFDYHFFKGDSDQDRPNIIL